MNWNECFLWFSIIQPNLISLSLSLFFAEANTLTIYGITTDDSGSYKCSAQNRFSSAFHEEQINVEGNFTLQFIKLQIIHEQRLCIISWLLYLFIFFLSSFSNLFIGAYVPANCVDNVFFANCKLIVKAKYCTHQYYAKFCCKSCHLAGQLSSFDTNLS